MMGKMPYGFIPDCSACSEWLPNHGFFGCWNPFARELYCEKFKKSEKTIFASGFHDRKLIY
jgi:hypothetical protein